MTRTVALVTCEEFADLDEDDKPLVDAFAAVDVEAVPAIWNDPDVRWKGFDAVLIRSPWDYVDHHQAFLAWLDAVDDATMLLNPASMVRWNLDKGYLGVLAAGGTPTVPTQFVQPGGYLRLPDHGEFVIKPTVSAGSRDTARFLAGTDTMAAVGHAQHILDGGRTVMIQPYVGSVDTDGETAMVYIDGVFSHAARKAPLLERGKAPPDGLFAREAIEPRTASPAQREVAERVLTSSPRSLGTPLYARVDLLDTSRGPVLLELELAEPSLFMGTTDGAHERLVSAVVGRLDDPDG